MMVWYGRFEGARELGWLGVRRKPPPRFWRVKPLFLGMIPEPKEWKVLFMKEMPLPWRSVTAK